LDADTELKRRRIGFGENHILPGNFSPTLAVIDILSLIRTLNAQLTCKMRSQALENAHKMQLTGIIFFSLFFTIQGQLISGLVQTTTLINAAPWYFPLGSNSLPLPTAAGAPTQNIAAPSWKVSSTPPASQPTLVYNCEQMAAICQNVQNWLTANQRTLPMEFTYDRTGSKGYVDLKAVYADRTLPAKDSFSEVRRNQMCDGVTWTNTPCPATNQPALIQSRFETDWNVIDVIKDASGNPTRFIDGKKDNTGAITTPSGMRCTSIPLVLNL
jgi:hypothetical protein